MLLTVALADDLHPLGDFLPHGICYLWNPWLMGIHVVTDGLIWLSYMAISAMLVYLVYKASRDIPYPLVFLAFGAFIVACGLTHFMSVWTLWNPDYWLRARSAC